jgi:hypothetical protein
MQKMTALQGFEVSLAGAAIFLIGLVLLLVSGAAAIVCMSPAE